MTTEFGTGIVKGEDSFEVGKHAAQEALLKIKGKPTFSIVFASSKYDYKEVIRGVREATNKAPLIGCSTAGEFTEEKVMNRSVACGVISTDSHKFFPSIGVGLKEDEVSCINQIVDNIPTSAMTIPEYSRLYSILLIDGLAGKGERAVSAASLILGGEVRFAGGAAGDDGKFEKTYVFCDDGVKENAASLCFIASKSPLIMGVKHGHHPISPPLEVTKVSENIVYELNNKPAWDVWKESKKEAKKLGIDPSDPKNFLLRCPAGIQVGTDYKIRWPISLPAEDGSLSFACSIPKGTVFRVTAGTKEDEIKSARIAAESAIEKSKGKKIAGAIVFDCACRGIILGAQFSKAINEIKSVLGNIPLVGFETYGEIAMEAGEFSGFHNTTTVILLIPE